ncbi:MAG TPA: hypothetical protein VFC19_08270 [Candidatus Limnocylindrales bacterium]|nr:hypothetical protein [Candidatus Limnocylindrales bacterium]
MTDVSPPDQPLSGAERAELERLRAQASARSHRGAHAWRWVGSLVLMVLAALIGLAAVTAVWLRAEILNTGRYVETVAPLASDPAIQQAVSARLSDEIVTRLDVQGLAVQLVQALEQRGVPPRLGERLNDLVPTIVSGIESFLNDKIDEVVASPQFAQFWANANRTAHEQVDAILTGKDSNLVSTNNTSIVIDLGQVLELVKQRLVEAGFSAAQRIPQMSIPYTVAQIDDLPKIQNAAELLNTLGWVLPILALLLGIAAVATAPNRRRGLLITVTILGVTLLLGLAAIALARERVMSNLPDTVRSPAAAAALWDTLIRFLISGLKTVIVLCAIVIVLTLLAGPSRLAHAIRHGLNRLLDWLGGLIGSIGLSLGPVPGALARNRVAIRVGLVVLAFMSLVLWRTPGIEGTLGVTAIALGILTIIEIIARIPPRKNEAAA